MSARFGALLGGSLVKLFSDRKDLMKNTTEEGKLEFGFGYVKPEILLTCARCLYVF